MKRFLIYCAQYFGFIAFSWVVGWGDPTRVLVFQAAFLLALHFYPKDEADEYTRQQIQIAWEEVDREREAAEVNE